MSQSPDADPRSDLETALTQIFGVAEVLMELGVKDEVAAYLGGIAMRRRMRSTGSTGWTSASRS